MFRFFFSKICRENSSFIKIRQEQGILYVKTFSHLWQYLAKFFLEWQMFQTKVVKKIKTRILCSIMFFENRVVYEIMSMNVVEPEGPHKTNVTIWRILFACWVSKATCTHAHARAHAPGHPRTHARTHTHTQKYIILNAFPRQPWFANAPQYSVIRIVRYLSCLLLP